MQPMPILFWIEIGAYSIATVNALALALMILATAPKQMINRLFTIFVTLEAVWAISAVFVRLSLWLDIGNANFWLELAAIALNAMGLILPMFAARYVGRETKWVDLLSALGFVALVFLSIPTFRDQLLLNPRLLESGIGTYDVTQWGLIIPLLPVPYFIWSFIILWRDRREKKSTYLALSVLVLMAGFLIGGILRPFLPAPILSITVTISVGILGYGIVQRQLFNPLRELTEQLEQKVQERTKELENSRDMLASQTAELERRSRYMEATADVAREASSVLELEKLLPRIAKLISERFELYRIGIFLLDPTGEWAALRATSSQKEDLKALVENLRIHVDGEGLVARVIRTRQPHLSEDVSQESDYLHVEAVADARSELTLPLEARGEVLGAMSIQSPELGAFGQEDVAVMQTLADQVAVAISNAQLFQRAQESLEAERRAYGELSRQAWREYLQTRSKMAFLRDNRGISAIDAWIDPEVEQVLATGKTSKSEDDGTKIGVPIQVRGQIVGAIDAHKPEDGGEWTEEQVALLETLADQVSEALEAARLFEDAQKRAAREQLSGEITDKMRRAAGVDRIVETALEELSNALGTSRAFVRLGVSPPEEEPPHE
jgi:GAF domain-containing protein